MTVPEDVRGARGKAVRLLSVKEPKLVVEWHGDGNVVRGIAKDHSVLYADNKETEVGQAHRLDIGYKVPTGIMVCRDRGGHRTQAPAELDWIGHPETERPA